MTEVASELENMPELVIVSGMSGAGRTEAMHAFEDLGYFCVDNLPSALIGNLLALTGMPGQPDNHRRIAVVCDARSGGFFKSLMEELAKLKSAGVDYRVLFLDADDEKLIARYKSSRRRHPLCTDGSSIAKGIEREREMLYGAKQAHHVIDTTDMMPAQLRETSSAVRARRGAARSAGHGVFVRLQARRPRGCRPGYGCAIPSEPVLRSRAAPAYRS